MRFRLTYEGPLQSTQRDAQNGQRSPLAPHKHAIRQHFHTQLKQLWQTNKFLREHTVTAGDGRFAQSCAPINAVGGPGHYSSPSSQPERLPLSEAIANLYQENGYRFVPLVREDFSLLCSLDIVLLRRDFTRGVISQGDLDNRIKTLIDTLRKPHSANELNGNPTPREGEDPFFCLLEDDDLVTGLTVETDMLLGPLEDGSTDLSDVKLMISVELKPEHVDMFNLSFV